MLETVWEMLMSDVLLWLPVARTDLTLSISPGGKFYLQLTVSSQKNVTVALLCSAQKYLRLLGFLLSG